MGGTIFQVPCSAIFADVILYHFPFTLLSLALKIFSQLEKQRKKEHFAITGVIKENALLV